MNGYLKSSGWVLGCLTLMLFLPVLSHAGNEFGATTKALEQQGFIRQDTGGPIGSDEMALDPFRNADQLNFGGILGPLGSGPDGGMFPPPFQGDNLFGGPDTRNMGFEEDFDHFKPISFSHSSS